MKLAHHESGENCQHNVQGEATQMTEFYAGFMPGLVDLTNIAFDDLMDLDESLVEDTLDRLMPRCAGMDSRLWNRNAMFSPDGADYLVGA